MISLFTIFQFSFCCIIFLVIYYVFIKPLRQMSFYKKQGIPMDFFPLGGFWYEGIQNTKLHGDFFYHQKNLAKSSPKPRAAGSNLGTSAFVSFIDPELSKEFFAHHELYTKPAGLLGLFRYFLNDGLVFSEGKQWKRHRKYTSMAFRFDLIKNLTPGIGEIIKDFCDDLAKRSDLSSIVFLEEFYILAGDIIGHVFFSEKFKNHSIEGTKISKLLVDTLTKVSQASFEPLTLLFGPSFVTKGFLKSHKNLIKQIKQIREWTAKLVSKKLAEIEKQKESSKSDRKSLFEIFYDQRTESEEAFTDQEIIDEFITLFLAGVDTTSHVVSRTIYFLERNPDCKKKLKDEVNKIMGDFSTVTLDHVNKLEYALACLKEAMRLQIPTPFIFIREALQDHKIGDINIMKGTYATTMFFCNNYDPNYHEDPDSFVPERWLDTNSITCKTTTNPYVFTPFSAGPRNCIGQHLALIQGRLMLACLTKNFDIKLKDPNHQQRMSLEFMYQPVVEPSYILRKI